MVRGVGLKMSKKKIVVVQVSPEFRNLLKVESALRGKSIYQFSKDLADSDLLMSEYLERVRVVGKKKTGGGFEFKF